MKMSNPINLTDLAESLAATAQQCYTEAGLEVTKGNTIGATVLHARRQALLDVRATVLAMIAERTANGLDDEDDGVLTVVEYTYESDPTVVVQVVATFRTQAEADGFAQAAEDAAHDHGTCEFEAEASAIEGTEGQDRESYTDDQDRDSYTVVECAECGRNDVVGVIGGLGYCTRHQNAVELLALRQEGSA
jgi:hypothetical protein